MTRRYPPVFSVILFIIAVYIVVANPVAIFAPWISAAINGIVMIIGCIFSAVGYVYDKYAIFTIHYSCGNHRSIWKTTVQQRS